MDRRTLASSVLSAFVGRKLSIELKSDVVVYGILDEVDGDMNITLGRCQAMIVEGPRRGEILPSSELTFISGRKIRYVQLDDDCSVIEQLRLTWLLRKKSVQTRQWIVDKPKSKRIKREQDGDRVGRRS